jgi:hypothetical protein
MGAIGAPGLEPATIAARYVDLAGSAAPPEELRLTPV